MLHQKNRILIYRIHWSVPAGTSWNAPTSRQHFFENRKTMRFFFDKIPFVFLFYPVMWIILWFNSFRSITHAHNLVWFVKECMYECLCGEHSFTSRIHSISVDIRINISCMFWISHLNGRVDHIFNW